MINELIKLEDLQRTVREVNPNSDPRAVIEQHRDIVEFIAGMFQDISHTIGIPPIEDAQAMACVGMTVVIIGHALDHKMEREVN